MEKAWNSSWSKAYNIIYETWWSSVMAWAAWLPVALGYYCLVMMRQKTEAAGWILKCTGSADPRLLGALSKTVSPAGGAGGWDERMDETHLSVFHSVLNCARGKALEKQYLFRSSVSFQLIFLISSKRLYDIHVTWFDWFLRREGDSTPHKKKWSFMFS